MVLTTCQNERAISFKSFEIIMRADEMLSELSEILRPSWLVELFQTTEIK